MATVVKNFRIKQGLVVEGSTGTINGQNILTETGSDQYILDLVGGENLIDSVASGLSVTDSVLSIDRTVVDGWYDASGAAAAAQTAAEDYADGLASNYDAAGAAAAAQTAAEDYADGLASNYDAAGAAAAAQTAAEDYADGVAAAAQTAAEGYTDTALGSYTPTSSLDTTIDGYGYLKSADLSGYATESYVGTAVDNLVAGAPGLLDTLNEIAAAINDDANYATTMSTALAAKQDELTAGSNISIVSDTISVTGLDSADISDFNTAALSATSAAYDAAGAAAAAQTAAEDYADGLASNYDASGTAAGLVDDLKNATTPFTAINVNDVAKQVAATTGNIVTAAATTAYSWSAADFRSAKFVVKAKNGVHTQVSDLVVTLDTSNNVAVSEYGITYSNGTELAAVTADYSGTDVRIRVTPANNNTEVVVVGTLIK